MRLHSTRAIIFVSGFSRPLQAMKRKLSLSEWAAFTEVVGTIGIITSLVFRVVSINKSTAEAAADSTQAFYDSVQSVELAVAVDARMVRDCHRGAKAGGQLDGAGAV